MSQNKTTNGFTKTLYASETIPPYRLCTFLGARNATLARAVTSTISGVSGHLGAPAAGNPLDLWVSGIALVEAGAAFAVGDPITCDSQGRGVAYDPLGPTYSRIIGFALEASTAAGAKVQVSIAPGQMNATGGEMVISDTAPSEPLAGQRWMDSSTADMKTYVWYDDGTSQQWILQSDPNGTIPNASETVAGLVEEATQAQVNAETDTGETGARLFVSPSKLHGHLDIYGIPTAVPITNLNTQTSYGAFSYAAGATGAPDAALGGLGSVVVSNSTNAIMNVTDENGESWTRTWD